MPNDVVLSAEQRGSLTVYPVESVRSLGVDAFVTDRFGGVSTPPFDTLNLGDHVGDLEEHVRENRRRVASAAGVDLARLVTVRQVHGAEVLDAARTDPLGEADALVCDRGGVALAILVADCVPLLMVDESTKRFAVVHAGWRGLQCGVLASALRHFDDAATVRVFLGPCVSREGYQVGPEVAEHFRDVPGALVADGGDRSRLDLRHVATQQLIHLGVRGDAIERSQQVTDGGELFFSDRATRPCGRFALVAKRAS
ncbi:MAG TPA: polyphenol oxidase family protein [Acidimicrobiales bacterium]|nr:polyphenol oxidase family protein [Acidimicrobiales bacterium]